MHLSLHPTEPEISVDERVLTAREAPQPDAARLEVTAVFVLALLVRLVHLDHTPYVDELNHVMAAHSLLANGTLRLADGDPYTRARLFTYLVAGAFAMARESLVVARIPAVLAGAGLVAAVYAWVRSIGGRGAAALAALLLCFQPESIYLSQLARFYTLQALLLWTGAVQLFRLTTGQPRARAMRIVGVAVAWLLAMHLQIETVVGIGALLLWAAGTRGPALVRSATRRQLAAAGAACVGIAIVAIAVLRAGAGASALALLRSADTWAQDAVHDPKFYHAILVDQYPTLWTLFPVLVLLAARRHARAALFVAIPFAIVLLVHSLAAWKAERYLFYVMPFFFATCALGVAEAFGWLRRIARNEVARWRPRLAPRTREAIVTALLAGATLFAAAGNGATSYAVKMLTVSDADWPLAVLYRGQADWRAARAALAPVVDSSAVVVSSPELKARYFLGRQDVLLSVDYVTDARGRRPEFSTYEKMRRPAISTVASMRAVARCVPSGLVVVERAQWRTPWGVTPDVAAFLETQLAPVPVPEGSRLLAFRWRAPIAADSAGCAAVREATLGAGRAAASGAS